MAHSRILFAAASAFLLATTACTHNLRVKNLAMYERPLKLGGGALGEKPTIGIMPFSASLDDLWYFNAVVERLSQDPGMGEVRTDYLARFIGARAFRPNLIVDIKPIATYRSSGWNFLISWPGFLVFVPTWNGYVYHADITTTFVIYDPDGNLLDQFDVRISYNIRHADLDRTVVAQGGGFLTPLTAVAFLGGVYHGFRFDRDVIPPLQTLTKDNYSTFVIAEAQQRLRRIAASVSKPPEPVQEVQKEVVSPEDDGEELTPPVAAPPPAEESERDGEPTVE